MKIKGYKIIASLAFVYFIGLGIYAHTRVFVWENSTTLKKELKDLIKERNDFKEDELKNKKLIN